jgi:hypothetical protein
MQHQVIWVPITGAAIDHIHTLAALAEGDSGPRTIFSGEAEALEAERVVRPDGSSNGCSYKATCGVRLVRMRRMMMMRRRRRIMLVLVLVLVLVLLVLVLVLVLLMVMMMTPPLT